MTSIWDFSKEEQDRMQKLGIDYSLSACLEYNPQSFEITDIESVLAVHEGENDGDDWRWVIKTTKECANLHNGNRFVFLQGGCDYTGWDCQSWATSEFAPTALKAAETALGNVQIGDKGPQDAGLGHMLSILEGSCGDNFKAVHDELVEQLKTKKKRTFREIKDEELQVGKLKKVGK